MLPNKVSCFLTFFDIFGYSSGASNLSKSSKIGCSILLVHIFLLTLCATYKSQLLFYFIVAFRPIEVVNGIFEYSCALYTYFFIVMDSLFYRNEHKLFWRIVGELSESHVHYQNQNYRSLTTKIVLHWCTSITWITLSCLTTSRNLQMYTMLFFFVFLIIMCEMRIFYFIFCIDVMCNQLKGINEKIKSYSTETTIKLKKFKEYRICYNSVYEMKNYLNKIFNLSQLVIISFCFYILLTDFNWVYSHYKEFDMMNGLCKQIERCAQCYKYI